MIHATDLTKRFGSVLAVDSVTFRIPRGEVVGFLGPNGAGKTTTIRMIAGFLPPSSGTVTVDGHDVTRSPLAVRRRIGYLPESTPLYTEMRVVDYLKFRARLFGVERRRRKIAVDRAIQRCWLHDVRRRPIGHLSKGYRQRVGLAAALLHEPPVLILDEPTVGLDPTQIREMRSLVTELRGKHTVLLSTHILPEAELTCDRILMIARGSVQAEGTVQELRESAARGCRFVVETDATDAEAAIGAMAEVTTTTSEKLEGPWMRVSAVPAGDAGDLREPIAKRMAERGAAVRALYRDVPSLEHVFMQRLASAESTGERIANRDSESSA